MGSVTLTLPLLESVFCFYYCRCLSLLAFRGEISARDHLLPTLSHSKLAEKSEFFDEIGPDACLGPSAHYLCRFVKKNWKWVQKKFQQLNFFEFFKGPRLKWTSEMDFFDNFALIEPSITHIAQISSDWACILENNLECWKLHGLRAWFLYTLYSETWKIHIANQIEFLLRLLTQFWCQKRKIWGWSA